MAMTSSFDLLLPANETHFPAFLNNNEEHQNPTMLLSDAAMAEELQLQEALQASLLASQFPNPFLHVIEIGESESSLSLCEICKEMRESKKLFKNGYCGHSFCSDLCINTHVEAKIKEGFKIVTCPGLNCDCVLNLDDFKHFLSKDVLNLLEKAEVMIPDFTCSKKSRAKMSSENVSKKMPSQSFDSPFIGPMLNGQTNSGSGPWTISGDDQEKVANDAERNIAAATSIGEASRSKWKGIKDEKEDHEIVWPPMVVIANTRLKKDENNKWIGMSTKELLNLFSSYNAIVKAQNFYKWHGHCGLSILILESSVEGYLEAECLHNHFAEEDKDRYAWNNRPAHILPNEERQLYGYMAVKEDVDGFNNNYFRGKPKLKYEMRSYQEMVVNQIRQDNHQLLWLKNRVTEQRSHAKDLEKSNTMLKEKLHMVSRDRNILRSTANLDHEQSMEEASLFTTQLPNPALHVKEIGEFESSLSFCEICMEMRESEKLFKSGNCGHSFCLDLCINKHVEAKIKEGFKIVTCPGLNCGCALKLDDFKQFLSKDVLNRLEKAEVMIPDFTCSKKSRAKMSSENVSKKMPSQSFDSPFIGPMLNGRTNSGSGPWTISRDDQEKVANDAERNIAAATSIGEASSSKWKGIKDEKEDHEIVWPPMVVIANTRLKKDENNKWIGMSTKELLNLFSSYNAIVKAQNFCKWYGHCGLSILIFESSVEGYLEAEHLHNHFAEEEKDRYAWTHMPVYFLPNGERQLYGYMAVKEDVDRFNNDYSKGEPKLKYEMRSYQEMVMNQIRQDNHQLLWLKNRVTEQRRHAKGLEISNTMLKEKLHMVTRDMDILRSKANLHHEQSMEEIVSQEQFYKDQIRTILESRNDKGGDFEKIQEEQQQQFMNIQGSEIEEVVESPKHTEHRETEKPAIAGQRVRSNSEFGARPQINPGVGNQQSMFFEKSWKELAIPVLGAAIPIIWKIIR